MNSISFMLSLVIWNVERNKWICESEGSMLNLFVTIKIPKRNFNQKGMRKKKDHWKLEFFSVAMSIVDWNTKQAELNDRIHELSCVNVSIHWILILDPEINNQKKNDN